MFAHEGGRHLPPRLRRGAVPAAVAAAGEDGHGHRVHTPARAAVRGRDRLRRKPVHDALESGQTRLARELGDCGRSDSLPTSERGKPPSP